MTDQTRDGALAWLLERLPHADRPARIVNFVNAHTLNLAASDSDYRAVLNRAHVVFGDGTGVRWAARARGVRLKANLNGTDLTPALMAAGGGRGHGYYLLGAGPDAIGRAAETAKGLFPGWEQVGHHHGYVHDGTGAAVIAEINRLRPNLLLVGMGNPIQERWLDAHRDQLRVPLAMAVGGLFDYWAGNLDRAPQWLRRAGLEWLHIMARQPRKAGRYLLGNPLFLARTLGWRSRDLEARR